MTFGTISNPIIWPSKMLPLRRIQCDVAPRTLSGGVSISGKSFFKASDAGVWTLSATIPIHSAQQIELVRGLAAMADGRRGVFQICIADCGRGPGAGPNYVLPDTRVPHAEAATGGGETPFSDGSFYEGGTYGMSLSAAAAVRATTLAVVVQTSPVVFPVPGHRFTIGKRLHEVRGVTPTAPATANLAIRPPLREPVGADVDCNFDEPSGLFRLAQDNGLNLNPDLLRFDTLQLDMVEA